MAKLTEQEIAAALAERPGWTREGGEIVKRYAKVLIPELNTGQLAMLIRSQHLVDARTFSKVQGQPIFAEELEDEILRMVDGRDTVMDEAKVMDG